MERIKDTLYITEEDIKSLFDKDISKAINLVEEAFIDRIEGKVLLPDKISQIFDQETQNRINCMPATLLDKKVCGVKWVSVFPNNPSIGIPNVHGTMILSEIEHGTTISILEAGTITDIRTAAVGALAAKYFARKNSKVIGFIGAGHQAMRHFELIKEVVPSIKKCFVSSRKDGSTGRFVKEEQYKYQDVSFYDCEDNYEDAIKNADIIVTATSTQKDILKASWIKDGALYIHVGGWEDEYAVAKKADKIICDEWECVKHRTQTISRMYKEGLLSDSDIYANIGDVIVKNKKARENDKEFIYFNSVGMAYIDVTFAKYIYDELSK